MQDAPAVPVPAHSAPSSDRVVLHAEHLHKEFTGADGSRIRVVDDVSLTVRRGEMLAIVGASGAGKSSLLHVLGALDRPTSGRIQLEGKALDTLSDDAVSAVRNRAVGFVFQFHHLLREFSALENVMMPLRIGGIAPTEAADRAEALLARVGLASRLHHRPSSMSGGEQQRTAVARALAARPALLLADEPSGNLDLENAEHLHDLFAELARDTSLGLIVVTHNPSLAGRADRTLLLEGGRLLDRTGGIVTPEETPDAL